MMRRYKSFISSYHTLYRLATTSNNINNFTSGVTRLAKNILRADKIEIILKTNNKIPFLKVSFNKGIQETKKGNLSILSKKEKSLFTSANPEITDFGLKYPIIFSEVIGIIIAERKHSKSEFDDLEKKWFSSLAEQTAIAVKVFMLEQEQKQTLIATVKSLTKFLDRYIPTSFIHIKKLSRIFNALAKELKLSETELKALKYASMLHDAGKVDIPVKLLKKHRSLTKKEYSLIKTHPKKGVSLIKDLKYLKPVIPIILYHHERYDGKGYPSGLKGKKIPLGARILSVIDAFDAMFFGRPYKEKLSLEETIREINKNSNTQFDPLVARALIKILRKKTIRKYLEQ